MSFTDMRKYLVFVLTLLYCTLGAQNITMPDSAAVVHNHVKSVKIYLVMDKGERMMNQYLIYDRLGRVVRESKDDKSYYHVYSYDANGREITSAKYSKQGMFYHKYTTEYINDTLTKVTLYQSYDSTQATHVYFRDQHARIVREEAYNRGQMNHLKIERYNSGGDVTYSYDSTGNSAVIYKNGLLVKVRSYNTDRALIHDYTYKHGEHGVTEIVDSVSPNQVTRYVVVYSAYGHVTGAERNGIKLSEAEFTKFQGDFMYVLPPTDGLAEEDGLPVPELINSHNITRDKKGNIIRDELTQKYGSFSQTFVYEYEYEFY